MLFRRVLQIGGLTLRRSIHHSPVWRNPLIPIVVEQTIDNKVAGDVIRNLLFLHNDDEKEKIHMYINSPGGVVTAGLAIYDTMQYISNPISTWCVGQAASIGSLLLAAGTKGMRHSLPNARIMFHQPTGSSIPRYRFTSELRPTEICGFKGIKRENIGEDSDSNRKSLHEWCLFVMMLSSSTGDVK
ncbi:hypothetical protein F2P81_014535 [Scophthalmus maximus]|uniref:ATP-dependent Clp protease proteolytic subunit n=1 Tax=Scophthalmus maximus TaxID=52904 RepID=A0A6A4SI19_SCOMX|nr:hypothetical protein F2P81_014535 [Scophthalmus maximus]